MSLFGRKEKEEIALLEKSLRFACDTLKDERIIEIDQYKKITELQEKLQVLSEKKEADIEMLRQMLIYKNEKIAELEESKEQIRQEKLRLEDRVEELQQELLNERERADRYADTVSASMEYGWGPVPEEELLEEGFTKTETGWRANENIKSF